MKRAPNVPRLGREQVLEAEKLSDPEARFLVANYYAAQEMRKRADMQIRHIGDKELPALLSYTADANAIMESQVRRGLKAYAESKPVGRWLMAQDGIAEVITAGFLAHLTIEHVDKLTGELVPTQTAGHWYSFAGLLPEKKWNKGEKRPWNADLKQICFHCGECFKRVSGKPGAYYGGLYQWRKALLVERNEAGHNAERAKTFTTKSADVKALLVQGKLPAGNLDRQACNWAVKILLSHLHALWYWDTYGVPPPKPFAIAILNHAHELRIPLTDMFPGFKEAYYPQAKAEKAA